MTETRTEQYDRMREILAKTNGRPRCKTEGCEATVEATRGPYAYLCELHKAERRRPAPEPAKFSLVQLARNVERAAAEKEQAVSAYEKAVEALRAAIP